MRYLSVCSGIEAATVAWHHMGWTPLAFSEIEKFPRAVLAHHYPDVPLHGDFTRLRDEPWIVDADVLVGGTPCQAFSVAGKRASLSDDRGNLTLEFVRLADAIDDVRRVGGQAPCVVVWENVPGVLSVKDNAFGCFLAALVGEDEPLVSPRGKWTNAGMVVGPQRQAAWRVLDAQYFGLAQRRRRVFVVASAREGFDPSQVLFEFEGVRRDTPPSRETRETVAGVSAVCPAGGSIKSDLDLHGGVISTLDASYGRGQGSRGNTERPVVLAFGGNRTSGPIDVSPALNACGTAAGRQDFETEAFIAEVAGTLPAGGAQAKSAGTATGQDAAAGLLVAHALRGEGFDAREDGTGRGTPLVAVPFDTTQITSSSNYSVPKAGDPCHPLAAGAHPPAVAFRYNMGGNDGGIYSDGSTATLTVESHPAVALPHAFDARQSDVIQYGNKTGALDTDGHTIGVLAFTAKDYGGDATHDLAPTMRAMAEGGGNANGGGPLTVAFQSSQSGVRVADTHATLDANNGSRRHNGVVVPAVAHVVNGNSTPETATEMAFPLRANDGSGNRQAIAVHAAAMAVRRLTPRECERLQGFPDDYTKISEKTADGPRYKALGNSMAVPVMRWIGERINKVTAA